MICTNCGAHIPDGMMICPDCCTEVQIVPDYNPLEDVLVREVRGSVAGATRQINSKKIRTQQSEKSRRTQNSTRVLNQNELDRIRSDNRRNVGKRRQTETYQNPETLRRKETAEKRKQQMLRKKRKKQQKRKALFTMIFFILIVAGVCGMIIYHSSYSGIVNKAYKALETNEYDTAMNYFNKAITKNPQRSEAYTGLAQVYMDQKDWEKAENVFLEALASQRENVEIYRAAIEYYLNTDQADEISVLLNGCSETVSAELEEYVAKTPEFSLEEGTYTEVQEISLKGDGKIYYTTDDSKPTTSSTLYEEAILLDEGTITIKAISVNEKGISSLIGSKTYTIDIPIADAPAVTPSTGQYNTATEIIIDVPEGYTAYYTMDGSTPTAASEKYTGPIDMPEGQTTFSAVLLSKTGKLTSVTQRSYLLEY